MYILAVVVDASLARALALPMAVPFLVGAGICLFLWERRTSEREAALHVKNPMDLWSAIKFAVIFALVMFAWKAGYQYYGTSGIYVTSVLSGLVNPDAFIISAAQLALQKTLAPNTANATILAACASNTLAKGGIAMLSGGRPLGRVIVPVFTTLTLASIAVCFWAAR